MAQEPILTAVAGIGGFGGAHHQALLELEAAGRIKLVAACDPREADLEKEKAKFRFAERGVAVYRDFDSMMEAHGGELGWVTVAAPIGLHAPMHRACVERGIPCYLEKPPTLDPEELEAMIATDGKAAFKTQVGFNYIYQPERVALKQRILSGEFGALRRVTTDALWPRNLAYYQRNNWAGRLFLGDYILLDSCCGNAISHHLQNILYFAGTGGLSDVARPERVEAELYRANPIEGTDTVFARGLLDSGVEFRIANSHAADWKDRQRTVEWYECDDATLCLRVHHGITIEYRDGRKVDLPLDQPTLLGNFNLYLDYLAGTVDRPVTLLSDCRGFVELNALLYVASDKITTVQPPFDEVLEGEHGTFHQIVGISEVLDTLVQTGQFPSETGLPWAVAGGEATRLGLPSLKPVLRAMQAAGNCVQK